MEFEQKISQLDERLDFLGGPKDVFERVGRNQLMTLLYLGLRPDHKVLDFGCGALRGGYWLIHFLNPHCYFGIEGRREMVQAGKEILLNENLIRCKQPKFDFNTDFDFSVFDEKFDYVITRSVWTHAPRSEITKSLRAFKENSKEDAVFASSIYLAVEEKNYLGDTYQGRNHKRDTGGIAFYELDTIKELCEKQNLTVHYLSERYFDIIGQTWLAITRGGI